MIVFILLVLRQSGFRLVKRRQALVETNLSRNSQLETHRSDERGSRVELAPLLLSAVVLCAFSRIDRSPHAWKNSPRPIADLSAVAKQLRTPRGSCIPARSGCEAGCSTARGTLPGVRSTHRCSGTCGPRSAPA